jgi:hypothetical protein
MVKIRMFPALLVSLLFLASFVSAQNPTIKNVVCSVIVSVKFAIDNIGPALVAIMFVYGGIKYVFSADDPGGRKQGKMICIHSVIGGILIALATAIIAIINLTGGC